MAQHRGPLAADFRRFYGLSLAGIRESGLPLHEVADLAAHLPDEGAVARARHIVPDALELARRQEHHLRVLRWQPTKAGHEGRDAPEPLLWPWEERESDAITGDGMTADEAAEWLGWTTPEE